MNNQTNIIELCQYDYETMLDFVNYAKSHEQSEQILQSFGDLIYSIVKINNGNLIKSLPFEIPDISHCKNIYKYLCESGYQKSQLLDELTATMLVEVLANTYNVLQTEIQSK